MLAERLENVLGSSPYWAEARYHRRQSQSLSVQKGLVKGAKSSITAGVGIRVLVDCAWGFSSTSDLSLTSLQKALKRAVDCAKSISQMKKAAVKALPSTRLARGDFKLPGYDELAAMRHDEKLDAVVRAEDQTRRLSAAIQSAINFMPTSPVY